MAKLCEGPTFPWGMTGNYYYIIIIIIIIMVSVLIQANKYNLSSACLKGGPARLLPMHQPVKSTETSIE